MGQGARPEGCAGRGGLARKGACDNGPPRGKLAFLLSSSGSFKVRYMTTTVSTCLKRVRVDALARRK